MMNICQITGCEKRRDGRSRLCPMHRYRKRNGLPEGELPERKFDDAKRFWEKVAQSDTGDCWEWQAGRVGSGYGGFMVRGSVVLAHRFSYEYMRAPIPDGLTIDHLCMNRTCVNPSHLEPVPREVNVARGNKSRGREEG